MAKTDEKSPKKVDEIKPSASKNSTEAEVKPQKDSDSPATKETVAKAGKRSAKSVKEAEEKAKKDAKKTAKSDAAEPKKGPTPKTRPKAERRAKRYKEAVKLIDTNKTYELKQALELVGKTSTVKFDASAELHVKLGVDPRQADQNIRQVVGLPHGTGKSIRVAVFADQDLHKEAKDAGADVVGDDDLLADIANQKLDFDVLIATPKVMSKLGQHAKVLGPKGLMPNPKSGTVTNQIGDAVKKAKAGQVEVRVDQNGIVHTTVGKVSFGTDKLLENTQTVLEAIKAAKPSSIKGTYIQSIHLSSSMGPSIKVQ